MTDHHDPDELASAHLDGTTTGDEAARVDGDPDLRARVEAMRAVREAIKQPVEVDSVAREAAVAAALDAFDETGVAARTPGATVTPIAPRRALSPTARRLLGAAAAVAVLALLVPLLARSGDDDSAGDAAFEETGAAIGGSGGGEAPAGDEGAAPEAAATSTTDLRPATMFGTFDDVDELLGALEARDGQLSSPMADLPTGYQTERSSSTCVADDAAIGFAVVAGRRVVVGLHHDAEGTRVVITDAVTCEIVADQRVR